MPIKSSPFLDQRRAGVLLHPSSLPSRYHIGDIGVEAYHFIDFLCSCNITIWQVLPLVPTHEDRSPYMGLSVLAGDPDLISLDSLVDWGWLNKASIENPASSSRGLREQCLAEALTHFEQRASDNERNQYQEFMLEHKHWLLDYALFVALRDENNGNSWVNWAVNLRDRQPEAVGQAQQRLAPRIKQVCFEQFIFFKQWLAVKNYANNKGVRIIGDLPIFVAHDSAEVWANRSNFDLLDNGQPRTVAGVPPDYFSETGQRWGNPHYNWKYMKADGFQWWIKRLRGTLELYDFIRVDHFRGFEAYWEIDAKADTAMDGHWKKTPGRALFDTLLEEFSTLPFIAEDLGTITPQVDKLRNKYGWPGMKILQFAFDGQAENPYLPHNYVPNCVVYTGTHDNDTTINWYQCLDDQTQENINEYLGYSSEAMPWPLIRCALSSTAHLAIIPMQDLLSLGCGHRMNTPGVQEGNWQWRFNWDMVDEHLAGKLERMMRIYQRNVE